MRSERRARLDKAQLQQGMITIDQTSKIASTNYADDIDGMRASEFSRLGDSVYLDHAGAALYSELQLRNIFQASNLLSTGKEVSWNT